MTLELFRAEAFRCLEHVELAPDGRFNLIVGPNASGKTSLLEAIAYLGRGRSFRGAPVPRLIRHGEREFTLFGKVRRGEGAVAAGVRNGPDGLEIRIDGRHEASVASLADVLPLQVIDPDVHELVAGGPEGRRRYLDGVAFHVEHGFLDAWRRFRRALKQRNAALKAGSGGLDAWSAEFVETGTRLDRERREVLEALSDGLNGFGETLLGEAVGFDYRPGWGSGMTLAEALEASTDRDLAGGNTHVGPHRADLALKMDDRQARQLVSRGQQKLLACSMVLAATGLVQARLGRRLLLLLDDPAAELDTSAIGRLMDAVFGLEPQVLATALDETALRFPRPATVFHVEHGRIRQAD